MAATSSSSNPTVIPAALAPGMTLNPGATTGPQQTLPANATLEQATALIPAAGATTDQQLQTYKIQPDGRNPLECFAHFQKHGKFGILEPIEKNRTSAWEPFVDAILQQGENDMKLVTSKDKDGAAYVSPEGKEMTANEYWRQKKYDECMFKFEDDAYNFAKQRYKLELLRLNRGHDSMDGGALWLGRALICKDTVWLALWGKSMNRFTVVLDTLRQRNVFCDTRMEYRPPVVLPRPFMQLTLNHTERPEVLKELVNFALNGLPIHVVDLRDGYN
ncbi:unnamed protein product [Amoebophrya sp. A120]|nr:unnamed protein product [Amoebophrya sp. A120]|eukprot:GSA120T00008464001.1